MKIKTICIYRKYVNSFHACIHIIGTTLCAPLARSALHRHEMRLRFRVCKRNTKRPVCAAEQPKIFRIYVKQKKRPFSDDDVDVDVSSINLIKLDLIQFFHSQMRCIALSLI